MSLQISYDQKRDGYFIKGMGFDFFMYFTGDAEETTAIECDCVKREFEDFELHLTIPLSGAKRLSCDIVETLVANKLQHYWEVS